jgi:beta-xylosidase
MRAETTGGAAAAPEMVVNRTAALKRILAFLLLAAAAPAPAAEPLFVPLIQKDFPDPFVLRAGDTFYAYATNGARGNVQTAVSKNLADWTLAADAMPELPPWAKKGSTWAPEVMKVGANYVLYFTARSRRHDRQCVGAATASAPQGPFASSAQEPLVCQPELGGTIDASPFRDADGTLYLYFKNDGNAVHKPTQIWVQALAPDGLSVTGEAQPVLRERLKWEGGLIEAPTMIRAPAGYFLFFSGNDFAWQRDQRLSAYSIGYATCDGPLGPCKEAGDKPFLYSFSSADGCLSGPGHQAVFNVGERWFIAFHAWSATPGCRPMDPVRWLYIAPLLWKDGKPEIGIGLRPTGAGR